MKLRIALVAAAVALAAGTADAQTRVNPNRSADQLNSRVLEVLRNREVTTSPVMVLPTTVVTAPAPVPAPVATPGMNLAGIYVGVNSGSNFRDSTDYQVGGVIGYQFHRNLAAEVTYDYNRSNQVNNGQMTMANLVYSRQLGQTAVTPYVLAGAGMGWNAHGTRGTGTNQALYNVGGGVRVNLVRNVDLDARYRYVAAFNDNDAQNQHMMTAGVNLRF